MPRMTRMNTSLSDAKDMSTKMESLRLDSSPDFGPVRYDINKLRPIGEMVTPVMPQSGYRERSNRLRHLGDEKNALIDELISKLESSEQQLSQCYLDQDRSTRQSLETQQIRDALQQEVDAMRVLLEQHSYVTVLIDGDSLTFEKEHLNKGERGGLEVAQLLQDSVKQFVLNVWPHIASVKVHIKLFADLRSLSETLSLSNHVENGEVFESFLTGLSSSDSLIDIYDTRLMKGLTTKKLKEAYRHDFMNVHCHQIFLAAVANDELNNLLDQSPDIPVHERVTLLEVQDLQACDQFLHEIASTKPNIGLVKVPDRSAMASTPVKVAAPALARIPSTSSTRTMNSGPAATSAASTPQLSWAAMTAQTFVPKTTEPRTAVLAPLSVNTPPAPAKATVVEVPRNKYGQRIDPVDASIPYQELQRIKKMKLCNIYYLVSKVDCPGNCGHSHTYPLSKYEKNILKEVARMTACHNRTDCDDVGCIYGHRCPQNKAEKRDCYYKETCRFSGWGHGIDEKVVKVRNIK